MQANIKIGILIAWTGMSCLAGFWYAGHSGNKATAAQGRKILHYHDPMHPSYRSDKPGIAPDCGMQLEPVYEGDAAELAEETSPPAGAVRISGEKQQAIGVRLGTAERTAGRGTVRLLGRVAVDDNRVYRILSGMDGWVQELSKSVAGSVVKKHDLLATLYGKDLLLGQQAFLLAGSVPERQKAAGQASQAQINQSLNQARAAADALRALGMNEEQLEEVRKARTPTDRVDVYAPVDGIILSRTIANGLRFDRNTELYRIAQLDKVWVVADLFEGDRHLIRANAAAHVVYQGSRLPARISADPPLFDAATRTLKVRLEVDNANLLLRPEMFVDIELSMDRSAALTVPVEAVLDSGLKKTVYVVRGEGTFEPRAVETGWRSGDRVQIVSGLQDGESIVVSGNFLIDSESRMQSASQLSVSTVTNGTVKDPSCGMDLEVAKAAGKSDHNGKTYYFCSKSCKEKFDKDPKKYGDAKQMAKL